VAGFPDVRAARVPENTIPFADRRRLALAEDARELAGPRLVDRSGPDTTVLDGQSD
jgi:hypothetical protein